MQKPLLPLIILCIVALPFIGKAQTMYSSVEPNAKLKKGDWFNIEFANQLEDYSTPVDSINYCDPENLLQLVLHCEVADVSKRKINLKITLERLFHITDSGEYFDSYFDIVTDQYHTLGGDVDYERTPYFEFETEVDLKNGNIDINMSETNRPFLFYGVQHFDIIEKDNENSEKTGDVRDRWRVLTIYFSEMERMIMAYLKDWSAIEYKLPLPTFGNLQVTQFRRYRIVDANLPVQQNTELFIEAEEITSNDSVEVIINDNFEDYTPPTKQHILKGFLEEGKIVFHCYLEKQKVLTLKYRGKEMTFIATPGKELHLKLHPEIAFLKAEFIGDNVGDNLSEVRLMPNHININLESTVFDFSFEEFHDFHEKKTANYIEILNQYKEQMSVNRYRKKLKMIYYSAATHSLYWHEKNDIPVNYAKIQKNQLITTELKDMAIYSNIQPLYDYYLEPEYYKIFLRTIKMTTIDHENLEIAESKGFKREFHRNLFIDYDIYNIFYQGYPKYYYLKELIGEISGPALALNRMHFDRFLNECKYPPFIGQVKSKYNKYSAIKRGESVMDIGLNFVQDKNYNQNNGKFKLIGFLNRKIDQQNINVLNDSIRNIEKRFNLKNKIEAYLVYTDFNNVSSIVETISNNSDIPIKLIKLSLAEFNFDREKLARTEYGYFSDQNSLIILLTGDSRIIDFDASLRNLDYSMSKYKRDQDRLREQKNYGQLIIIILSSLLFFGLLSWFVIRVRTRQIKNRESARRKVSELELTAIRSQMNPHFIFNAMGSIQNLINQNKVKNANLYLASFARLMRMVLANSNKKLVSMSHELELIETYLKLEQLRVDFTFTISVAENIDPEVEELPGMLIQPFIENAVIHGITPKGKGNINVAFSKKENTLICEITDDGVGIDTAKVANGNGLAMKLSEKRLDLLNSQLQDKLKLVVENRMETEKTSGTRVILYIPVG